MMAFGEYAKYYDLLYADKDYPAETAFVREIIRRLRRVPVRYWSWVAGARATPWNLCKTVLQSPGPISVRR
jgi:hypothetical protein